MKGYARIVIVVAALLAPAACSDDPNADTTTTPSVTTTTDGATTTATTTTTGSSSTSVAPNTTIVDTTSTPASTPTTTSTTVPYPTTTVHAVPDDCDGDRMLAVVDDAVAAARLAPGDGWEVDGTTTFDERTNDAEEFRDRLALDCRLRAVQRTDDGDRLVLAAWTGTRHAFVVQAADGPTSPYASDQNLQLLYEQPYGEWLEEQETWAGTLAGGETVIVAVDDTSLGATAKAWQALPRWEDLPITIESERYAIDVLLHAGARNVSPGEEPAFGSTIAAIQFVTPAGLPLIATVAPVGDFDPTAPIVDGERATVDVAGTDVLVTTASPDSYAAASVGWECGDHVWFIDAAWGTVDELVAWTSELIAAGGCG